ncbi:Protein trichome birefringence-like 2 [Linum grandiflorum]
MEAKKLGGLQYGFSLWIATTFLVFLSVLMLTTSLQRRVSFQGVGDVNSSSAASATASTIVSSWPFTIPTSYVPPQQPNSTADADALGVVLGKVSSNRNGSSESVRRNVTESKTLPVAGERNNNGNADGGQDVKQSIEDSYQNCDIFDGRWERDESKPFYPAGSCPHIDRSFNCHANGRPDSGFVKWRWQPNVCDIPRLNATDFLERLRGKKLVFVGDSLNRNMWESLVCILSHSITNKTKVHEISGKTDFKRLQLYRGFCWLPVPCSRIVLLQWEWYARDVKVGLDGQYNFHVR